LLRNGLVLAESPKSLESELGSPAALEILLLALGAESVRLAFGDCGDRAARVGIAADRCEQASETAKAILAILRVS